MKDNIKIITLLVMLFTVVSKVTGFVREQIIALKYGASNTADIFMTAFSIPVYISNIIGGIIISVFIPLFVEVEKKEGLQNAKEFASRLFTFLTSVLFILLIFLLLGNSYLEKWLFGENIDTPVLMFILPVTFFMSISIFFTSYLNANKKYVLPQFSSIVMNVAFIAIVFLLSSNIYILLLASIISSILQLLYLYWTIVKQGFRPKLQFKFDSKLKEFLILALPIFLGSMSVQSFTIFDKIFAKNLPEGSISSLGYAQKLTQLPMGIIATTISTIIFSKLAEYVATKEYKLINNTLFNGLKVTTIITLPLVLMFYIYSEAITEFIYGRGAFDNKAINLTVEAMKMYSLGIIGSSLTMIISRVFLSSKRVKIVVLSNIGSAIVNVILAFFLVKFYGHKGLALANSIAYTLNFLVLFTIYFIEQSKEHIIKQYVVLIAKVIAVTTCMCVFMNYSLKLVNNSYVYLICFAILSCLLYLVLCIFLRIVTIKDLKIQSKEQGESV
ncbi:murein biosynthesis integral membrane protein MurJ [Niallia sp. BSM11]|uniref:murein biosynthesis integral membrane protein MurJ n=1 Tax=Niallia sp. BSM11 TaxID=3391576 RepID=UPI003984FA73